MTPPGSQAWWLPGNPTLWGGAGGVSYNLRMTSALPHQEGVVLWSLALAWPGQSGCKGLSLGAEATGMALSVQGWGQ